MRYHLYVFHRTLIEVEAGEDGRIIVTRYRPLTECEIEELESEGHKWGADWTLLERQNGGFHSLFE